MNRRQFLTSSILAALGLSACGGGGTTASSEIPSDNSGNSGEGNSNFKNALLIPDELKGQAVNGRMQYDLTLQKGTHQFYEGVNTPTWGANGSYLGPTIRLKNGDAVDIKYTNKLGENTTIHGHGMHLPAKMDGGAHQVIKAGESWTSSYTVKQHACTNWYHPHLMGKTAQHVMNGLAGLIIIDDDNSEALDLPKTYGVDDIPLIIQDRSFNSDGSFKYNPSNMQIMMGWKGDTFIVNGGIKPYVDVEAKQIRFRILNGSNSRIYNFAFASGKSFKQIATDNSFLESPVELTQLSLSPAERAEIVVDFSADKGKSEIFKDKSSGAELFKVNINKTATQTTNLATTLVSLPALNPADAVNTRSFDLGGMGGMRGMGGGMGGGPSAMLKINGKSMDMAVINETVPLNAIEIWEVRNNMRMDHNFHIHATHFQLLERNGKASNVAENEKGFKDTVHVPPNESVKFIVKMTDYSDASSPYMYHCHLLEHEDAGMMGQFVVV